MYHIELRDKWTSSCWGVHPEVHYLQPAHTSKHITKWITGLCSKPAMVHTFSVCVLSAQMVLMRFIWQSVPSQAHSGLLDCYRIVKKCPHTCVHKHTHTQTKISEMSSAFVFGQKVRFKPCITCHDASLY